MDEYKHRVEKYVGDLEKKIVIQQAIIDQQDALIKLLEQQAALLNEQLKLKGANE